MRENNIIDIAKYTRRQLVGTRRLSGVMDDLKSQWDSAISDFQAKRQALDQAESDLYAVYDQAAQDPDDLAEWQSSFNKLNAAMSTMDAVANAVTTVAGWWN